MLPLNLLTTAKDHEVLVEVKTGDAFNGVLVACDTMMNLTLRNVIRTGADGTKFWRYDECHIRGGSVKYLGIPDEVMVKMNEEIQKNRSNALQARRSASGSGTGNTGGNQQNRQQQSGYNRHYQQQHQGQQQGQRYSGSGTGGGRGGGSGGGGSGGGGGGYRNDGRGGNRQNQGHRKFNQQNQ
ncbi:Sm-like ribonucleoprotein [Ramicandelaber brevisporus]|nr:Sm-like ribonucleoprotein [Ramicandelaber brevisporus]